MQGTILLNHDENLQQVEEEEKSRFLYQILGQMFENTDAAQQITDIWDGGTLQPTQKIQLRSLFSTFGIIVQDDQDGHMTIFVEGEKVGEFFKPTYKLMKDIKAIDRKKQLYLEMTINFWSMFEKNENQ